jgi:sugar lactone lactonase YvrE
MQVTTTTRRGFLGLGAALGGAVVLGAGQGTARATDVRARGSWPTTLNLPDGFHPADITIGRQPYAYFASLLGGAVCRVSLVSGRNDVIYPGLGDGYMAIGIQADHRGRLFVAGGWGRTITVIDAANGAVLRTYEVGIPHSCVNHVTVTQEGAWFTDACNGLLFGLLFGPGGSLPRQDEVVTRELSGEWVQGPQDVITSAGVAPTPDGRALLVVNQFTDGGTLFRIDRSTGSARRVPLGSLKLPTANGITLHGRTLYAPQQTDLTAIRLDRTGHNGSPVLRLTDPRFDTPCAAAVYGDRLYLANSRFPLPPTPTTKYNAVSIPLPV